MKLLYLTFVFVFINLMVFAQNYSKYGIDTDYNIPKGLEIGEMAPVFEGLNQNGIRISLSEELKKGKVVLIFYRGYWCPYCSRYLKQYQDSLQMVIKEGAQIIAITPEHNEGVNKTIQIIKSDFDIISDVNNSIQKQYNVLFKVTDKYNMKIKRFLSADIAIVNGDEEAFLPVPATIIIGQNGIIEYIQFDPNYKKRASVRDILENL